MEEIRKKSQRGQKARSGFAPRIESWLLAASYENSQFSNLLSAPMTTWPLVVVLPLELLGWKFLPWTRI